MTVILKAEVSMTTPESRTVEERLYDLLQATRYNHRPDAEYDNSGDWQEWVKDILAAAKEHGLVIGEGELAWDVERFQAAAEIALDARDRFRGEIPIDLFSAMEPLRFILKESRKPLESPSMTTERTPQDIAALIDEPPFVRRTRVRTPGVSQGSITAWHVRKFVRALDAAGIPDSTMIDSRKANDTLHLIELSAVKEETR